MLPFAIGLFLVLSSNFISFKSLMSLKIYIELAAKQNNTKVYIEF